MIVLTLRELVNKVDFNEFNIVELDTVLESEYSTVQSIRKIA